MTHLVQLIILSSSALAMVLIARGERACDGRQKRAGAVVGLVGQPFWLWHSWDSSAWGVLVLTVIFAGSYWTILRANWRVA